MVQRISGSLGDLEMIISPDPGEVRPSFPEREPGILPKPRAFDFVTFTLKGSEGEAHIEVAAQTIRWDFRERFDRWKDEFSG